jgi:hypothetical protein
MAPFWRGTARGPLIGAIKRSTAIKPKATDIIEGPMLKWNATNATAGKSVIHGTLSPNMGLSAHRIRTAIAVTTIASP